MMPLPILLAACLAAAVAGSAHAGRPLVTEDAGVLDARACEFESFASRTRGTTTTRGALVQLSCGIGAGLQAALALSRSRADGSAVRAASLLGKTRLGDASEDETAYALAWQLGADDADGDWRAETAALAAVASVPLADALTLHANLGWTRSRAAHRSTTGWALAVERAGVVRNVDLMAEAFADDRDRDPWLQAAVRWAVRPGLFLDGSVGVQAAARRSRAATLGVKAAF
jgi:hypothetical protein